MCGIFGYIGKRKNASAVVLEGLKLLEYRGYDSWGITVKSGKKLTVDKHTGKIGNATVTLPSSEIGIGHTRWATHGGVTEVNAHPHLDCNQELAVVHNGIIENFAELRTDLQKRGHTFVSETDTEVVSHLIEENLKIEGFVSSVRDAFNKLRGLNAIVVVYAPSKEIIAVKNGSPLVVGKADGEYFIASDAAGIIKHTNTVLFLKDNEMVVLGDGIQLLQMPKGIKIKPQFETINWKIEDVDKGKYEHFMLKEIHEQPKVIKNIAHEYTEQIENLAEIIANAKGTFFIAAGTAYYACLTGMYWFSKIAHKHVNSAVASEFNYLEDFLNSKSLVIALSQSGETIDVVEPLNRAKQKKSKIVAITNVLGSTVYRLADYKLLLGAGPEKAVASTKAYIAKLSVLFMLSFALDGKTQKAQKLLIEAANEIERLLEEKNVKKLQSIVTVLSKAEHIYTIGRGVSFGSALEAALKIKEVSYIHTEGLAGGELKHGTLALISKGTPCIVFAPNDDTYESMLSNAMEIKSRGGVIIGISSKQSPIFDYWIEVRDIGEASIIAQIVPAQLLGYYLALKKKYDPDKPRNLAKSVTVK